MKLDLKTRLMSKIVRHKNGCWVWKGSVFKKTNGEYGQIRINNKVRFAHRVCYELLVSKVADGLELDHLCRNTLCINPKHLEPVTHHENVLRGNRVNRTNKCPKGHPYSAGVRYCKICSNKRANEWYLARREEMKARFRRHYLEHRNVKNPRIKDPV